MKKIGIIGCGKWSNKIISEINRNNFFVFNSIVCKSKRNVKLDENIIIFEKNEDLISSKLVDCIFVAAEPKTNLDVVKSLSEHKYPLILEKPLSDTFLNSKEIMQICKNEDRIIIPNLTNLFSEIYSYLDKLVQENINQIKRIIIVEGDNGPIRNYVNPVWDWGFHPLSVINSLFYQNKISNIIKYDLKKSKIDNKQIVSLFSMEIDNHINTKIITGNFFKKKIRKLKIILKNNDIYLGDFLRHEIYLNNKLLFKNKKTPLESLLSKFNSIINQNDKNTCVKLIDISCKTIEILEKFNKC